MQLTTYLIIKDNAFSLRTVKTQECLHLSLQFDILLDFLASEIKQEKEVKFIQGNKGKNKILFADDKAVYIEKSPKIDTKVTKAN